MRQERTKGQAGMGGRGKNQERGKQDVGTRRTEQKSGGGASLTRASDNPRYNQQRNQDKWHEQKRMRSRY
jgi:hypothetical protein